MLIVACCGFIGSGFIVKTGKHTTPQKQRAIIADFGVAHSLPTDELPKALDKILKKSYNYRVESFEDYFHTTRIKWTHPKADAGKIPKVFNKLLNMSRELTQSNDYFNDP